MNIWQDARDVFLMMETEEGVSYAAAVAYLDAQPSSVKWERYMENIMEGPEEGTDYDPENAYPDGLPCVFNWNAATIQVTRQQKQRSENKRGQQAMSPFVGGVVAGVLVGGFLSGIAALFGMSGKRRT